MRWFLLISAGCTLCTEICRAQCPDGRPSPCAPVRPAVAPPTPKERARRILLLPFRNVTRAPAQDWLVAGAPLLLGEALGQFTDLTVVPDQRLTAAMRRFSLPRDVPPDLTQLRQLASETGGWTAISGNVIATGNRIRISAEALDIPTGQVTNRADTEIGPDGDVRQAIDRLAAQLLNAAGVRGKSLSLEVLTTQSIEAYRRYVDGLVLVRQGAFRRAVAALTEAVRLDSSFALAWSTLSLAAVQAGGLQEFLNPVGTAARAADQALRHSDRLSPRLAATSRVLADAFRADFAHAHRLADSLVATDAEDELARTWLSIIEVLDSRLDTTTTPFSRSGSFNRAVEMSKAVLDRDPGRLEVYGFPATVYGFTAGFLRDVVGGRRKPASSFAAEFLTPQDITFMPVLRDSIEFVPDSVFRRWPEAEQHAAFVRGANAGADWVTRWMGASPNDPEPHLWMSRFEEVRGNYAKSLAELDRVVAIGSESNLENLRARRMSLLELTGRHTAAETLADSIVQAGGVRNGGFHPALDRSRAYVTAIYLRSKQWEKAAALARMFGSPRPGAAACESLSLELANRLFQVAPPARRAVADTVAAHIEELRRLPDLTACADGLARRP